MSWNKGNKMNTLFGSIPKTILRRQVLLNIYL